MDQLVSPSGSSWIQMGPVGSNLTQWDPVGPIWIQIGASSVKYYVPEFGACTPIVFIRWMIAGKFARSVFLRYCNIVFWKTLNDSNRIIKFLPSRPLSVVHENRVKTCEWEMCHHHRKYATKCWFFMSESKWYPNYFMTYLVIHWRTTTKKWSFIAIITIMLFLKSIKHSYVQYLLAPKTTDNNNHSVNQLW